jgi:glycosidase
MNDREPLLDGVFNHTGRGHWAFASLLDAQEQSPYRGWFLPKSFPVRAYDVERHQVNYECWWDLPVGLHSLPGGVRLVTRTIILAVILTAK